MNNMEWKEYFQDRIKATPILAKGNTGNNIFKERAIMFRLSRFANDFLMGNTDSRLIVMYGLRGIGKSTILLQLYNRLTTGKLFREVDETKKVSPENIIYISIDQTLLQSIFQESKSPLLEAVKKFCEEIHGQTIEKLDKKIFVFIDEAQFDPNWAVAAKTIYDSTKNIFLIITGSSAMALHLNTDTARRAIKEPLFPLSFLEYNVIKNNIFPIQNTSDKLKRLVLQNDITTAPEINKSMQSILTEMKNKGKNFESELNEYITLGGLPNSLPSTKEITYRRLIDMINRIVNQDLPLVDNFESKTIPDIIRIVGSLASKPQGELSQNKLAQHLSIPVAKVKTILEALEKTQLIFSVKPFPDTKPVDGLSKQFKYYFMTPTLLSAIRFFNGKTIASPQEESNLWEHAVAGTLYKLCYTTGTIYNLFYDPTTKDSCVDFILQNPLSGEVIPIEVGLNKDNIQVKDAIERYKSRYGIVVSNFDEITIRDKIIKIPFWIFLYM
ncbi:AAA domain protein [uncultured archaeon]|nr:AAA domain protein [uncultured archaeon]